MKETTKVQLNERSNVEDIKDSLIESKIINNTNINLIKYKE